HAAAGDPELAGTDAPGLRRFADTVGPAYRVPCRPPSHRHRPYLRQPVSAHDPALSDLPSPLLHLFGAADHGYAGEALGRPARALHWRWAEHAFRRVLSWQCPTAIR